ncbi:MAG: hypothetical protein COB73_04865 [Flavobacteriaceae bacterium]|nr:MAG: hypothetical protein COB73_04865 [Flavobacteriaceae bacterium]
MKLLVQILLFYLISIKINAQDLEPRFLSSVPNHTNFIGLVYGFSSGGIYLDSQEIEGLRADLNTTTTFYGRSFKLFNKPGKFDIVVPYSFGNLNALVSGVDTTVYKNGFHDPTFRISMILVGDKALDIKDFAKREIKKFKLGTAFKVRTPIGRYDDAKLINLGANRWGFQFKVASSYKVTKRIVIELHVDSWFFTKNNSFFNGNTLQQKPLLSAQIHVAYIFGPKLWASASIGQVALGGSKINDVDQNNNLVNSKYAGTVSYRVSKLGSLKAIFTNGLYVGRGADFTTALLSYTFVWFDKK